MFFAPIGVDFFNANISIHYFVYRLFQQIYLNIQLSQKYIFVKIWYLNNKINYILELNKNKPILYIVMYSDTYGQIYLFTKILIELFQ